MFSLFKHGNGKLFDYIKEIKNIGKILIVRLKGSIDAATIPLLQENMRAQRGKIFGMNVLLDFGDVTHVDSATIAGLVLLLRDGVKERRKVGVINVPPILQSYLDVEKIKPLFLVSDSEESALRELA